MSTEHDYSPGSRQYKWLENDLRNVNRSLTPWVIIGGHRAMYCSESIKSKLSFFFSVEQFLLLLKKGTKNSILQISQSPKKVIRYFSPNLNNLTKALIREETESDVVQ